MAEQWRFKKPDWKSKATYAGVEKLTRKQMAWEFLRRGFIYHRYYVASLDATSMRDRENALQELRHDAPLIWYVPKKKSKKYYRFKQTLGDFVRRVRRDSAVNPRDLLRVRNIDPSRFGLTKFIDPNETPLIDQAIFEKVFIESIVADEEWSEKKKRDVLRLGEYEVLLKLDVRNPAPATKVALEKVLKKLSADIKEKNSKARVGIRDRKEDRGLLLRTFDAKQARAKPAVREPILYPQSAYKNTNLKNTFGEAVRSARDLVTQRYRFLAQLEEKTLGK